MKTKRIWMGSKADPVVGIISLVLILGGLIAFIVLYIIFMYIGFLVLAIVMSVPFLLLFLFAALFIASYAILDEKTITVKTLFGRTRIKQYWSDITSIQRQKMHIDHISQFNLSFMLNFVFIYFKGETSPIASLKLSFCFNKNIIPIMPTRKNLAILREYIKNYEDYGDALTNTDMFR